jgi:hypothetical protein
MIETDLAAYVGAQEAMKVEFDSQSEFERHLWSNAAIVGG